MVKLRDGDAEVCWTMVGQDLGCFEGKHPDLFEAVFVARGPPPRGSFIITGDGSQGSGQPLPAARYERVGIQVPTGYPVLGAGVVRQPVLCHQRRGRSVHQLRDQDPHPKEARSIGVTVVTVPSREHLCAAVCVSIFSLWMFVCYSPARLRLEVDESKENPSSNIFIPSAGKRFCWFNRRPIHCFLIFFCRVWMSSNISTCHMVIPSTAQIVVEINNAENLIAKGRWHFCWNWNLSSFCLWGWETRHIRFYFCSSRPLVPIFRIEWGRNNMSEWQSVADVLPRFPFCLCATTAYVHL